MDSFGLSISVHRFNNFLKHLPLEITKKMNDVQKASFIFLFIKLFLSLQDI